MTTSQQKTVTLLLVRAAKGERDAGDDLWKYVYAELHTLATALFKRERKNHTLEPTALVNEAYVRLIDLHDIEWQSRNHFFALCAKAMRNILVGHARDKGRQKRGGGWQRLTLANVEDGVDDRNVLDLEALDIALTKLAELDERKAKLVELRFFAGLKMDDAAEVLGIARSTAAEDWRLTKAWLSRELQGDG